MAYSDSLLALNPRAYYNFEVDAFALNSPVYDASGNNRNGEVVDVSGNYSQSTSLVPSKTNGQSVAIAGSSGFRVHRDALPAAGESWSLVCTFKTTSMNAANGLFRADLPGSPGGSIKLHVTGAGAVSFNQAGEGGFIGNGSVLISTSYHLVVSYFQGNMYLQLRDGDGNQIDSPVYQTGSWPEPAPDGLNHASMYVGGGNSAGFEIDEMAFYDGLIDGNQRTELYEAWSAPDESETGGGDPPMGTIINPGSFSPQGSPSTTVNFQAFVATIFGYNSLNLRKEHSGNNGASWTTLYTYEGVSPGGEFNFSCPTSAGKLVRVVTVTPDGQYESYSSSYGIPGAEPETPPVTPPVTPSKPKVDPAVFFDSPAPRTRYRPGRMGRR